MSKRVTKARIKERLIRWLKTPQGRRAAESMAKACDIAALRRQVHYMHALVRGAYWEGAEDRMRTPERTTTVMWERSFTKLNLDRTKLL